MVSIGMALSAHNTTHMIASIESRKHEQLKSLDVKFESADRAKKSFAYVAILSLVLIFIVFFLNDLTRLRIRLVTNSVQRVDFKNHQSDSKLRYEEAAYSTLLRERLARAYVQLLQAKRKKSYLNETI